VIRDIFPLKNKTKIADNHNTFWFYTLAGKDDGLVKSQFSPPLAGSDEGEGENAHPNFPPSRGMGLGTFYEFVKDQFAERDNGHGRVVQQDI
jgi:hypothetical protein